MSDVIRMAVCKVPKNGRQHRALREGRAQVDYFFVPRSEFNAAGEDGRHAIIHRCIAETFGDKYRGHAYAVSVNDAEISDKPVLQ